MLLGDFFQAHIGYLVIKQAFFLLFKRNIDWGICLVIGPSSSNHLSRRGCLHLYLQYKNKKLFWVNANIFETYSHFCRLFHTMGYEFSAKHSFGFLVRLWSPCITRNQSRFFSELILHNHLTSKAMFKAQILPTSIPPPSLGERTLTQATNLFFDISHVPP